MAGAFSKITASVTTIASQCDIVATIDNSGSIPMLESFRVVDRSHNWSAIARRFALREEELDDFPNVLAPICIERLDLAVVDSIDVATGQLFLLSGEGDSAVAALHLIACCARITLSHEAAEEAMVPLDARKFAFVYPGAVLEKGGFVYIGADGRVVGLTQFTMTPRPHMLTYGSGIEIGGGIRSALWHRCTATPVGKFRRRGAVKWTFLRPAELVQPVGAATEPPLRDSGHGGFCFLFDDPHLDRYFPILGSGAFTEKGV